GDMIRLTYESAGVSVLLALQTATTASRAVWLLSMSQDPSAPSPNTPVTAAVFTREAITSPLNEQDSIDGFQIVYNAEFVDNKITLKLLDCPLADAPQPGSLLRIDQAGHQWWMTVDSLDFTSGDAGVPVLSGSAS